MSQATIRAFPNLARVVDVGRTARAAARLGRSSFASLAALGEAKLSGFRTARERAEALTRLSRELLGIHGVEVELIGVVPERPCLLVANQVSAFDPLVVLSQIPAAPVMRAEVAGWPIVGTAAAALGARFAGDPTARARVLRGVLTALRTGVPVLDFPEGAHPGGDRVGRFHRATFGLAILCGLPVVPIALAADGAPADGLWRLAARPAARVTMTVRAPMWGRPGEAPEDLAGRVRTAIALAVEPPALHRPPLRSISPRPGDGFGYTARP